MNAYNKYKPSGIKWIGDIPEHWDTIRLKNIGVFSSSGIDKKIVEGEQIIKIINYTDVYGNLSYVLNDNAEYMKVSCPKKRFEKHKIQKGDLIFTPSSETIEDIGVSAIVNEDFENTAYSYHVLRFRFYKDISHNYKRYICNNHLTQNYYSSVAVGTTRKILGRDDFNNTIVFLPPKSEQTQIANYLDQKTSQTDQTITQKEKLIELYEEEKKAMINQAVTKGLNKNVKLKPSGIKWLGNIPEHWDVKRFKYYFELITKKDKNGTKKIGLENIESETGEFIETNTVFEGDGVEFFENDILYGKLRPYLAKVYLANFNGSAVGDFYIFRCFKQVIPEFAKYRFLDYSFIDVTNSSTYGAKMPRVSWDFIANLVIAFPPTKEQTEIVRHIEEQSKRINKAITKAKKEIELIKEYRQALIFEAVTGKIDLREETT